MTSPSAFTEGWDRVVPRVRRETTRRACRGKRTEKAGAQRQLEGGPATWSVRDSAFLSFHHDAAPQRSALVLPPPFASRTAETTRFVVSAAYVRDAKGASGLCRTPGQADLHSATIETVAVSFGCGVPSL